MPTYAFRCLKCSKEYEELVQRFGQTAPCPECGSSDVERLISAPAARVGTRLREKLSRDAGCSSPPGFGFG
ncbi:MAG: zinc ribbon domain-containing protein [Phycisphaerae bacterium]|nr:zinc ribbon domain-containing protein [Phycisphaerae bacterium]